MGGFAVVPSPFAIAAKRPYEAGSHSNKRKPAASKCSSLMAASTKLTLRIIAKLVQSLNKKAFID